MSRTKSLSDIEKRKAAKNLKRLPKNCFLLPNERKFNTCRSNKKVDCDLLRIGYIRAKGWSKKKPRNMSYKKALRAASNKAKKEGCTWFRGTPFPKVKKTNGNSRKEFIDILEKRSKMD